jgi:NADPH-dependent curcumin reductase CurA
VLCGAISGYNAREKTVGPRNYTNLISRRGRMEGFIILDYLDRFAEGQAEMAGYVADGRVKFATHVVEGLEQAPAALNLLFTGGNRGKVIVKVE